MLEGHRRGIASLHYKGNLVISGSHDNDIRSGTNLDKTFVAGEKWKRHLLYNHFIKIYNSLLSRIWDIECGLCVRVLQGHQNLVR